MPEDCRRFEIFAERFTSKYFNQDDVNTRVERLFGNLDKLGQDKVASGLLNAIESIQGNASRQVQHQAENLAARAEKFCGDVDQPDPLSFDYTDGSDFGF